MFKGKRYRLTKDEARKIGKKGGLASVEARRRRKKMREIMEVVLYDVKVPDTVRARLEAMGIDADEVNNMVAVSVALVLKAEQGDVNAYKTICKILGEWPSAKSECKLLPEGVRIEIGFVETEVKPKSSEDEVKV